MGVSFTEEQQKVIDLRDRNILVSAAAGSGKTMVLVERIIRRLTEPASPIDVDRLLVVTFTQAAAAEMKERIRGAIEKELEKRPEDAHLQRQATLVHQAKVTTIHSFCLSVIRDYFHMIDLDPGFRIGEEGELKLLRQDVADAVLEDWYREGTPKFIRFVESFATGRDDRCISELILKLYAYSRSYPDPDAWLAGCVRYYSFSCEEELEKAPFVRNLLEEVRKIAKDAKEELQFARELCLAKDGPDGYLDAIELDLAMLEEIEGADSYAGMGAVFLKTSWKRLSGNHKNEVVSEKKAETAKQIRDACKESISRLGSEFFFADAEAVREGMNAAKENAEVLVELVRAFAASYAEKKKSRNLIDYGDMEHFALQILTREEGGKRVPGPAAKEYREKFEEIMIDEYQDSNYVQEAILTSVSGVSEGRYNMFMVGDVKQSIYRFRLARAELFMDKYNTYSEEESDCQKIDLSRNFRSRREVIDSVNFLFRQIMTSSFGQIGYDDKAALYAGAAYEEKPGNETEVLLVDTDETGEELTAREAEALTVARRIRQLVGQHLVLDKKTGMYRKAQYADIVILTRSLKGWSDVFQRVLAEEGVPAYCVSGEGYFQAREIQMLLDYLRVLDNPRQDVPFAAVLSSPFADLTAEELAVIAADGCAPAAPGGTFYDRALAYAERGEEGALREKLRGFLAVLSAFREKVPYTAIHDLLWEILEKTGYGDYTAALPAGSQRTANLEMLIEKAVSFESTSYKGLFHFVRYIEQLEKYDVDYGEANILDESSDVVRILSIHKSKGLEFPIVFVVGMGKKFNLQDARTGVVLHSELGAGIDYIDTESRERFPSLLKNVIKWEVQNETVAEELRILYVAMTRAKEKLILTGVVSKLEERLRGYEILARRQETALPYARIAGAGKYADWILPALYRSRVMDAVRDRCGLPHPWQNRLYGEPLPVVVRVIGESERLEEAEKEEKSRALTRQMFANWRTDVVYDGQMREHVEQQFSFVYPYGKESAARQKVSVSELKKRLYLEEEEIEEETVIPLLPKFAGREEKRTGAFRGSAYHRVLQLLDFSLDYDARRMREAIGGMVSRNLLTEEMAACVDVPELLAFCESSVGKRLKKAYGLGLSHAERPFVLSEGETLIQGIIDVYFEEDGELVVLDYKTDRAVSRKELTDRYQIQLDYYARVLSQVTGKHVKEKILYSFALQTEIEV